MIVHVPLGGACTGCGVVVAVGTSAAPIVPRTLNGPPPRGTTTNCTTRHDDDTAAPSQVTALDVETGSRSDTTVLDDADAVVAAEPEPMEYVRVCDAYGTGFFVGAGASGAGTAPGGFGGSASEFNQAGVESFGRQDRAAADAEMLALGVEAARAQFGEQCPVERGAESAAAPFGRQIDAGLGGPAVGGARAERPGLGVATHGAVVGERHRRRQSVRGRGGGWLGSGRRRRTGVCGWRRGGSCDSCA